MERSRSGLSELKRRSAAAKVECEMMEVETDNSLKLTLLAGEMCGNLSADPNSLIPNLCIE